MDWSINAYQEWYFHYRYCFSTGLLNKKCLIKNLILGEARILILG